MTTAGGSSAVTGTAAAAAAASCAAPKAAPVGATGKDSKKEKNQAVCELVGMLEDARKNDSNSYEAQIAELRKKKHEQKKENKRLSLELKKIDNKKRAVLKHCEKASTEELLEVLRHRTIRSQKRSEAASSSASPKSKKARDSDDD